MEKIKIQGIDEEIYTATAKSGLTIYVWKDEHAHSFDLSLSVKYGSVNTEFEVKNKKYKVPNGIAHFMEHIKFNVKKGVTANDLFDPLGSYINAFTTFKYTSYLVSGTSKINENVNNLLDYVFNPYFTKEMINKERGIIAAEIKMGYDQPYNNLFFAFYQSIFIKEKFRNLISGELDDIKKINLDDIKLIYNTFYHPSNCFLIVTGNVNPYDIEVMVNENLSKKKIPKFTNYKLIKSREPSYVREKERVIPSNIEVAKAKVGLKLNKKNFAKYNDIKLNIIFYIILNNNFGDTSTLKENLLNEGLITFMEASRNIMNDYIILDVTLESNYLDEAIKRVKNTFKKLVMSEEDLKRKINSLIATLVTNYDSVEQVNNMLQNYIINYKKIIPNLKEIYEGITLDQVLEVIDKIDTKEFCVVKMIKEE